MIEVAVAGAMFGSLITLIAVWWAKSRALRRAERTNEVYRQEDAIMLTCPHDTPICTDCGAMLPPPATFPWVTTASANNTRWNVTVSLRP